jgi:hypothetical protein
MIGLCGFSALIYGVYLSFGLGPAFMLGGGLLLLYALIAMAKMQRGRAC